MRELTRSEKLVFGEDAQIDPVTGLPIENGIGAATMRELTAKRDAEAAHTAEHERLQQAEKTLTERLAEAHDEREQLITRAETAEAAHVEATELAEKAEAAHAETAAERDEAIKRAEAAEVAHAAAIQAQTHQSTTIEH